MDNILQEHLEKNPELTRVDCPLTHTFSEGIYHREIFMPKGTFIIGHQHNTTHLNIITQGKARVWMDGVIEEIEAPCTFESKAGIRKILLIEEDMKWATIHVTNETDIETLENTLVDKQASNNLQLEEIANVARKALQCQWLGLQ